MKLNLIFKTVILCGCLWACSACRDKQTVVDILDEAETLMTESPDSAYTLLQTLPVDELHQDKNRARYALLYSQVLDKNYIDETNDSLINIAVEYYRTTDDVRSKFLSFYYQGRIYTNAGELHKAMLAYMEAEQLADAVTDGYLSGLLYAELGKIYRLYYDYPKSLDANLKSIEAYEQAGKFRHRNYMWLNQGRIYRNMGKNLESVRLLRMALAKGVDTTFWNSIDIAYAPFLSYIDDNLKCTHSFVPFPNHPQYSYHYLDILKSKYFNLVR